jgi:hypothetical protein
MMSMIAAAKTKVVSRPAAADIISIVGEPALTT